MSDSMADVDRFDAHTPPMTTLVLRHATTPAQSHALRAPIDSRLVKEAGDDVLVAVEGPVHDWHRELRIEPDGALIEEINFRLALGVWTPLMTFAARWAIRRNRLDTAMGRSTKAAWWAPPDRLDQRGASVLAACCTLAVIGGFVGGLLGQTITFVSSDLHWNVRTQSNVLAVIRFGAILTLIGLALADRVGRRPMIRWTLILAAMAVSLGSLAQGVAWVTTSQLLCRGLVAVGVLLLPILVCEEVPAGTRAYSVGLLAMSGGLGIGMVLWVLPAADISLGAWRWIWALAVLTIPAILAVTRHLPESQHFSADVRSAAVLIDRPAVRRSWLVATIGIVVFLNLYVAPVAQLQNEFLRTARGFSATRLVLFVIGTNTWGGIGVVVGGKLADRFSRHRVAAVGLLGLSLGNAVMYSTSGWPMWVASALGSIVGGATVPALGVLGPELFPTHRRGGVGGILNICATVGGAVGLWLAGSLIDQSGYGVAFRWLSIAPLAVLALLFLVPETARRDLNEISRDP